MGQAFFHQVDSGLVVLPGWLAEPYPPGGDIKFIYEIQIYSKF